MASSHISLPLEGAGRLGFCDFQILGEEGAQGIRTPAFLPFE